jgi:hypothetical protein
LIVAVLTLAAIDNARRVQHPLRRAERNRMTHRLRLAVAAAVFAAVPLAAGPALAAQNHRARHHKPTRHRTKVLHSTTSKTVTTTDPSAPQTPAPAPAVTSVISIGGYVFYNLTYPEAVAAYDAAVAAAGGSTPPPVTSVSVTTTVGGNG